MVTGTAPVLGFNMKEIISTVKKIGKRVLGPIKERIEFIHYCSEWKEKWNRFNSLGTDNYENEIRELYKAKIGTDLNLETPTRFTEKIQWRKLMDRNPIYTQLTDKLEVRKWVERKIGPNYLIPLLGSWEKAEDINFETLPRSFVLKTNNGSKTNIIVRDKAKIDKEFSKKKLEFWLHYPVAAFSLELHYLNIAPKIIAEEYLAPDRGEDIEDYKFLCFSGEPKYFWVDTDRSSHHKRNVYDMDWKLQDWTVGKNPKIQEEVKPPESFDKMVDIARILSKGFAHVRVDLYNVSGRIYFGEMTFTSGGGIEPFVPDEMDEVIGKMWNVSINQVDERIILG